MIQFEEYKIEIGTIFLFIINSCALIIWFTFERNIIIVAIDREDENIMKKSS